MAELQYHKQRISRKSNVLKEFNKTKHTIDQPFVMPEEKQQAFQLLQNRKAQLNEAMITLTELVSATETLIQKTDDSIRQCSVERHPELFQEFSDYLESGVLDRMDDASEFRTRILFRESEIDHQIKLLERLKDVPPRPAVDPQEKDAPVEQTQEEPRQYAQNGRASAIHRNGAENRTERSANARIIDGTGLDDDLSDYGSVRSTTTSNQSHSRFVRLPQLSVPKFDGDIREFTSFWTTFKSMIHNNESLNDSDKFLFLKEALHGNALRLISPLPVIGSNYSKAVKLLKGRYDKGHCMTDLVINDIHRIRMAEQSTKSCRSTLDLLKAKMAVLECQKMDLDDNPLWRSTILSKFPPRITRSVIAAERKYDTTFYVEQILDEIESEISLSETVDLTVSTLHEFHKGENSGGTTKNQQRRSSEKRTDKKRFPCVCGELHNPYTCSKFPTVTDRRQELKRTKACWYCFQTDHRSAECTLNLRKCFACQGDHHGALCYEKEKSISSGSSFTKGTSPGKPTATNQGQSKSKEKWIKPNTVSANANDVVSSNENSEDYANSNDSVNANANTVTNQMKTGNSQTSESYQVILMTAHALIFNEHEKDYQPVKVFIDTGAQRSFIKSELSTSLELPVLNERTLSVTGFGELTAQFLSNEVSVTLKNPKTGDKLRNLSLSTKEKLTTSIATAALSKDDRAYIRNHKLSIAQENLQEQIISPSLLIGQDLIGRIIHTNQPNISLPSGLLLTPTVFGYAISGKGKCPNKHQSPVVDCAEYSTVEVEAPVLNQVLEDYKMDLKNLYEIESIGLQTPKNENEQEIMQFMKEYRSTITIDDGKATAGFPFLPEVNQLKDNFRVAARRLESLIRDLSTVPDKALLYEKTLQDYLSQGIIEEVTSRPSNGITTFYMPHRYVWSPDKSTKLRIVFDAASKARNELSLNDTIFEGHSFIPAIYDVLMRFRTYPYVMTSDIQKAFLQIRLLESHRDATRFLWVRDVSKPAQGDNLRCFRFCRIPFGINASPCILNQTILKHLEQFDTESSREIASLIYVDNVLLSGNSPCDLIRKYSESKHYFDTLGMNLRDYLSNSHEVNEKITGTDRAQSTEMKILGIVWNASEDSLTLSIKEKVHKTISKRSVLSHINGACFDPLGLVSPLMVKSKVFLQDLHRKRVKWDEELNDVDKARWKEIVNEMAGFSVTLPRIVSPPEETSHRTLSIFVDSSKRVYACVAYITTQTNSGTVTRLYSAKAKVAPIKHEQTVPKLEMLAIFIGMNLAETIIETSGFTFEQVNIFSDSTIALSWVQSGKRLPSFVTQLAQKIQQVKLRISANQPVLFHHVPTEENIADVATRGFTSEESVDHVWWQGPQWLNEDKWPTRQIMGSETFDTHGYAYEETEDNYPVLENSEVKESPRQNFWPVDRLSSFSKLKKVVSFVVRFVKHCRSGKHLDMNLPSSDYSSLRISGSEMANAERILIKSEQATTDLSTLLRSCKNMKIQYDENGILRRYGRLDNSHLSFDAVNPIYLPKKGKLAKLVISDLHFRRAHCGTNQLVCEVRQKYWIPHDRNQCKAVTKLCSICKIWNSYPFKYPDLGSLPAERVQKAAPFSFVGVDYFGPITVKSSEGETKCWVALFTCFVTRLLHLEVAEDLSARAFLLVFKRFIARRGVPIRIYSDNGSNFKLSERIIRQGSDECSDETNVSDYFATHHIDWTFIPPASPFMGGVWERMVGLVKRSLEKSIGKRKYDREMFHTIICEAEALVNSRPLSSTGFDEGGTLRPVDFITKYIKYGTDQLDSHENDEDPEYLPGVLLKSHKDAKKALDEAEKASEKFWVKWSKDYLVSLRGSSEKSFFNYRSTNRTPEKNEIVLVDEDNASSRGNWPKARIVDLVQSKDHQIRSVWLQYPNGRTVQRPVNRIIPLELKSADVDQDNNDMSHDQSAPMSISAHKHIPVAAPDIAENTDLDMNTFIRRQPPRKAKTKTICDGTMKTAIAAPLLLLCIGLAIITPSEGNVLSCITGGVQVNTTEYGFPPSTQQEICVDHSNCVQFIAPNTTYQHHISTVLSIHDHTFQWRAISTNLQYRENEFCAGIIICELINCYLCPEMLGNPHCWPKSAIVSLATLFYLLSTLLYFICRCCIGNYIAQKFCRLIWKCGACLIRTSRIGAHRKREYAKLDNEDIISLQPNTSSSQVSPRSKIVAILAVVITIQSVNSCQLLHTFNSTKSHAD